MSRVKLSWLLAASLILTVFLGYNNYILQAENLRLKTEIQKISELQNALEAKYAELRSMHDRLFDNYNALNQSFSMLQLNYTTILLDYGETLTKYASLAVAHDLLNQTYNMLLSEHEKTLESYEDLTATYYSLNQTFNLLFQNYTALLSDYQRALADYVEVAVAYASLNQTYTTLLENYTLLKQDYMRLEQGAANYRVLLSEYQELTQRYQSLLANYTLLKKEYEELYFVLYKPLLLKDKVVPTVEELKQWLAEDKTNELSYKLPDFVCGDYAVMLHMHAKLKRWDMGVVAVIGKLSDGKEFNHAFNAIICKEGLRYVEPQNDQVFSAPIDVGFWYDHPGFGRVYVQEFIIVVLYDNA